MLTTLKPPALSSPPATPVALYTSWPFAAVSAASAPGKAKACATARAAPAAKPAALAAAGSSPACSSGLRSVPPPEKSAAGVDHGVSAQPDEFHAGFSAQMPMGDAAASVASPTAASLSSP